MEEKQIQWGYYKGVEGDVLIFLVKLLIRATLQLKGALLRTQEGVHSCLNMQHVYQTVDKQANSELLICVSEC